MFPKGGRHLFQGLFGSDDVVAASVARGAVGGENEASGIDVTSQGGSCAAEEHGESSGGQRDLGLDEREREGGREEGTEVGR